ncbi:hypothetical protein ALTERO38_80058 [Alteromonas sp. 38]|nr:hypothetical protein ALTERO38_80058 [Alteromonas sp. 38]
MIQCLIVNWCVLGVLPNAMIKGMWAVGEFEHGVLS